LYQFFENSLNLCQQEIQNAPNKFPFSAKFDSKKGRKKKTLKKAEKIK
jgi:hypothetical protein